MPADRLFVNFKGAIILNLTLFPHKTRVITFYSADDGDVPVQLYKECETFDFTPRFPLPFSKKDFTAMFGCRDVLWIGGRKGLIRYCESEKEEYDRVMYFSADRDLKDNHVLSVFGTENDVWVRTESAVSHIVLKEMSMEEKANILLNETVTIVDRFGMISQRGLMKSWALDKPCKWTESDNDGGFTASFCMGEMFHYAVLKKEKGADHSETQRIRKIAVRSLEACLLLMFISGRDDGFVARTYLTKDAPAPTGGLFLRRQGDKAVVLETRFSREFDLVGAVCDASDPIPERLRHLYEDEGYTQDDLIFKGDTSSDEITLHVMNLYYAHLIFGDEDSELDALIKKAVTGLVDHIISHGYELVDFYGKPTTWAKWSEQYFTAGIGWGDAPLNAAEMLMYLKAALSICGENEKWQKEYEKLLDKGYADLPVLHYERAVTAAVSGGFNVCEDIMYGDHMLANLSFFGLMLLEKDEALRKKYLAGWKSWRDTSIAREHHPIYDIPFAVVCPQEETDGEKLKMWFYRSNASALASSVSLDKRRDVPKKEYMAGYRQTSWLLPPDERAISKYDRDSLHDVNEESGGKNTVETCSPFTLPYWMGRYYGILKEGEKENG